MGAFALNLLVHLVTDFNKRVITIFDALFGTSVRHLATVLSTSFRKSFFAWCLTQKK